MKAWMALFLLLSFVLGALLGSWITSHHPHVLEVALTFLLLKHHVETKP